MQQALVCAFAFIVLASAARLAERSAVSPVEKVIELLQKLERQVTEEGQKEAAQYDKFACFCKAQADGKQYAIEKSKDKEEFLTAEIKALTGEIEQLEADAEELGKKAEELDGEIKEETAARAKAREEYETAEADLAGAISACEEAIKVLKASKAKMTDAKVDLLQVARAAKGPSGGRPAGPRRLAVASLLEAGQTQTPERKGYEYRSNDIIDTIRKLKLEFVNEKKDLDAAEFEDKTAADKKVLGLSNERKFALQDKDQKEQLAKEKTEELATAKTDLEAEEAARKADESFMEELTATCETKATEWDERSKTRAAELTAIGEAITALETGVKPKYGSTKLAGLQKAPAFLQLSGGRRAVSRALKLLQSAAVRLRSASLERVAAAVQATGDFDKVIGLIEDLIKRLEEEAAEEADQKSFCDEEMTKAVEGREEAEAAVEEAEAEIEQKNAREAELAEETAKLTKEMAEANKALLEATELRASEKAANEQTLADAEAGKQAVEQALEVLKGFYGSAFLQVDQGPAGADREGNTVSDLAPETFEGTYEGKKEESKGVIGLLEVILSDFERTLTSVGEDESKAESDFEAFEGETKADLEAKEGERADKEKESSDIKDELTELEDTVVSGKRTIETSREEVAKLQAMCVVGMTTYEERQAQREEEIASLKEALDILSNWKSL